MALAAEKRAKTEEKEGERLPGRILVVDDEKSLAGILRRELQRFGHTVDICFGGREALAMLNLKGYGVMILDLKMPDINGIQVLQKIKKVPDPPEVIILTGHATVENALAAMKLGAFEYLRKPFKLSSLNLVIGKALAKRAAYEDDRLIQNRVEEAEIVYRSGKMARVMDLIPKIASSDSTVLVIGESGTGKELIACEIHKNSLRASGPMIDINCSAIQDTLLESELFGFEKGAFTGADTCKPGLFELADSGTIFLDEVGDLSLRLQAKILRALESKSFFRVGGTRNISVNVRVVAATNKDLKALIQKTLFREDLYYRLSTIVMHLPALRERKDDIPVLCEYFLSQLMPERPFIISAKAMSLLHSYDWPGNVRELKNVMERAILVCRGNVIEPADLCPDISASALGKTAGVEEGESQMVCLRDLEKQQIIKVLDAVDWHRGEAARLLGISPKTLYRKIREFRLQSPQPSEVK